MSDFPSQSLQPIGDVIEELARRGFHATHSSLRFIEREGLIAPLRTRGGHRLYAADDVDRIVQIKTWQAQRLTLSEIKERLAIAPADLAVEIPHHLLHGDLERAADLLFAADDAGAPLVHLFGNVLQPALEEVGARWAEGTLQVSEEKEISEFTREVILRLSVRHRLVGVQTGVAVAACVEGEHHEFGLQMIAGILRACGWRIHLLGSDVEVRFLREAVARTSPTIVLLSATLPERLPAVEAAIAAISSQPVAPLIFVGGAAVTGAESLVRSWGALPIVESELEIAITAVNNAQAISTSGA